MRLFSRFKNMVNDSVKAIVKSVSILKAFTSENPTLSISEIIKKVRIPKATAYRLVKTLVRTGLLEKNHVKGKYKVGPELYILGSLYLNATDVLKAGEQVIDEINSIINETVTMSVYDAGYITIIMKRDGQSNIRLTVDIGFKIPAYASAMGKAFLSELSDGELDVLYPGEQLKPITNNTITTKTALKKDLELIRNTGISFSESGWIDGTLGIGALVRNSKGEAIAGIAITMISHGVKESIKGKYAKLIQMAASLISYKVGFQNAFPVVHNIEEIRTWCRRNDLYVQAKYGRRTG